MCISNLGEKQVAGEDITCWKFGTLKETIFESLVFRFKYELGKSYKSNIVINGSEGFSGFHTIQLEKNIEKIRSMDVVRCIIPKGSSYYAGNYTNLNEDVVGCFISEELIVVEKRK